MSNEQLLLIVAILVIGFLVLAWLITQRKVSPNGNHISVTIEALLARNDALIEEVKLLKAELIVVRRELKDALDKLAAQISETARLRAAVPPPDIYAGPKLLVGIGDDPALTVDLAVLRAVKTRTGLDFTRVQPITKMSLERVLSRRRLTGDPIIYLHLGLHASPDGVQFSDGVADGIWLSERLSGILVLLIAGCRSDMVGDLLGVVPAVITLRENLRHEDASDMTTAFWSAIGEGLTPEAAFIRMRDRCPAVAEFAELLR